MSNIISSFTNKLTSNHGIEPGQASGIASNLIPSVLSSLVIRTNDPKNSSFNIGSIISLLVGGGSNAGGANSGGLDIGSLISQFTGGDAGSNGGGGLSDIISKVTSGAQQQQRQSSGGGLMNIISGFIK